VVNIEHDGIHCPSSITDGCRTSERFDEGRLCVSTTSCSGTAVWHRIGPRAQSDGLPRILDQLSAFDQYRCGGPARVSRPVFQETAWQCRSARSSNDEYAGRDCRGAIRANRRNSSRGRVLCCPLKTTNNEELFPFYEGPRPPRQCQSPRREPPDVPCRRSASVRGDVAKLMLGELVRRRGLPGPRPEPHILEQSGSSAAGFVF